MKQMNASLWASEQEVAPIALDPITGEKVAERYYKSQEAASEEAAATSIIKIDTN